MRRRSKRSRWPAVRRNLLLGLLLGVLQLLALGEVIDFWHLHLSWWLYELAGALFYLLISGLAGFLAAQKTGDDNTGVGAGCLVGAVSIIIAITVALITNPPPYGVSDSNAGGFLLFLVVFSEGFGGTIVTVIGSSIGESLGQRRFLALYQSGKISDRPSD